MVNSIIIRIYFSRYECLVLWEYFRLIYCHNCPRRLYCQHTALSSVDFSAHLLILKKKKNGLCIQYLDFWTFPSLYNFFGPGEFSWYPSSTVAILLGCIQCVCLWAKLRGYPVTNPAVSWYEGGRPGSPSLSLWLPARPPTWCVAECMRGTGATTRVDHNLYWHLFCDGLIMVRRDCTNQMSLQTDRIKPVNSAPLQRPLTNIFF